MHEEGFTCLVCTFTRSLLSHIRRRIIPRCRCCRCCRPCIAFHPPVSLASRRLRNAYLRPNAASQRALAVDDSKTGYHTLLYAPSHLHKLNTRDITTGFLKVLRTRRRTEKQKEMTWKVVTLFCCGVCVWPDMGSGRRCCR